MLLFVNGSVLVVNVWRLLLGACLLCFRGCVFVVQCVLMFRCLLFVVG